MQKNVFKTFVYIFLFVLAACKSHPGEVAIPRSILEKDTMLSVLKDLSLLEAGIDLGLVPGAGTPSQPDKYYTIFKKHSISKGEYDSSLVFYSSHPELLSKIYEKLITDLSKSQAELNKH